MVDGNKMPKVPSNWQPEQDKVRIACLGKAGEETGEFINALCRCLIQGIDGRHPETGKPNKVMLEEEIADMYAQLQLVIEEFNLLPSAERTFEKIRHKRAWFDMLRKE